ncbi:hypothetical protein COCON_G00142330 [Conger conger]|uniref:Proteolipid protein 2 n=1 Tax=Conger conger TaxID=82655 RepID=A0A9Q1DBI3_CONCO|nr:proteolipid protein 2b [Conger conger]KAJ8265134.1 hypothetical protein COCON_G00142330 [Conger conger]
MADTTEPSCIDKLKSYVRTRKGTILLAEIILSFIIIICYAASYFGGYSTVAICEMVFAIVFMVVYMLELDKQFRVISWPWSDFIRATIGAALYLITSLISVIQGTGDGARIAGGVLGMLAGVLFGYDAYLTFMTIKSNRQHTAAPTDEA